MRFSSPPFPLPSRPPTPPSPALATRHSCLLRSSLRPYLPHILAQATTIRTIFSLSVLAIFSPICSLGKPGDSSVLTLSEHYLSLLSSLSSSPTSSLWSTTCVAPRHLPPDQTTANVRPICRSMLLGHRVRTSMLMLRLVQTPLTN